MAELKLEKTDRGFKYERLIPETSEIVRFEAAHITDSNGRPHAVISIILNTRILAYTYMSLARDEERVRLANSAYRMFESDSPVRAEHYSKEFLKHDLDLFAREVWPAYVNASKGEMMAGDVSPSESVLVLDPYVIRGGGTILYGPPGMGKSWTLLLWLVSIDAGKQWPWATVQTPTLFVNIERSSDSVARRLGAVNAALDLPRDRPLLTLNARGRSLKDIEEALATTIYEHNVGLVGLDSISRAGFGELGGDKTANAIVDTLNNLCATWVGIGHSPRNEATHVFGSVHFDAGADMITRLASEQRGNVLGVVLNLDKANDVPKGAKQLFAYEFDKTGLTSVRMSTASEFADLEEAVGGSHLSVEDVVMQGLENLGGKATASQISIRTGKDRSSVSAILSKGREDGTLASSQDGRDVYYERKTAIKSVVADRTPDLPF